jgi:hypothetical protein
MNSNIIALKIINKNVVKPVKKWLSNDWISDGPLVFFTTIISVFTITGISTTFIIGPSIGLPILCLGIIITMVVSLICLDS